MKIITLTVLAALAVILLAGCVTSLHPLYTADDAYVDPFLVGTWNETNDDGVWVFRIDGDNVYKVSYTTDNQTDQFTGHLVRIGADRFLDLVPREPVCGGQFYKMHLVPSHSFLRIGQEGETLRFALLDYEWAKKALQEDRFAVGHQLIDDRLLLTSPTGELQAFVAQCAAIPEAWSDVVILQRAPAAE